MPIDKIATASRGGAGSRDRPHNNTAPQRAPTKLPQLFFLNDYPLDQYVNNIEIKSTAIEQQRCGRRYTHTYPAAGHASLTPAPAIPIRQAMQCPINWLLPVP